MFHRHTPAVLAAALAMLATVCPAHAETLRDEAAVVVTASRFHDVDHNAAANVVTITRREIAELPAATLPDVLKTRAGIDMRPTAGSLGIDATIDMRGFGDTGTSNTLILVDGLRVNPIDMGAISWSAIPLASIERIEIIRGAGAVLYGDRASGGVINIVTDKSGRSAASVVADAGSHGYRTVDARLAGGSDAVYFNLAGRYARDDGWRRNNEQDQQAIAGRGGLRLAAGEAFVDFAAYRDSSGLPGYLRSAAYAADPHAAGTPLDTQSRDGARLRPGVHLDITSTLTLEAEVADERERQHADYVSFGSVADRDKDTRSATPRLRWQHGLGALASETVAGIDYYDGSVRARYSAAPSQRADQTSRAVYVQNSTALDEAWTVTFGGRHQRMDQSAHQDAYAAWFQPALDGAATRSRNAFDLGVTRSGQGWRAYGKVGTTFRFANTDELFGFDSVRGVSVFAGNLKPQHGTIGEVGGSVKAGAFDGHAALYRLNLTDEIGYDGAIGTNVNFAPTRRQGLETELAWRAAERLTTRFAYTWTDAEFREGAYAGRRVPLVPRHKATAQASWNAGRAGTYTALVNYVGRRPFSGDLANDSANAQAMLPSYTTADLQAAWNFKPWTITARVLNAFDKRYAPFAGYSPYISDRYYYPADGRSFHLGARYDFL